jgi:protein TonB
LKPLRAFCSLFTLSLFALLVGCATTELGQQPVAIFRTPPEYPFELRKQGITGSALVEFIVTKEGDVANAFAVQASHPLFALHAVNCVSKWKFKPGMVGTRAVNTRMQQPISFDLAAPPPLQK